MRRIGFLAVLSGIFYPACAKTTPTPAPQACSLSAVELEFRQGEIASLFAEGCREVKELPEGFAFRFEGGTVAHRRVTDLAKKETECCPFLSLDVGESQEGSFWVRVTGSPEAKEFVRDMLNASTNP